MQALLVTELVFGLLLRRAWLKQAIRPAAWGSAALTCVGLGFFVAVHQPEGGTPTPSVHAWAGVLAVFGGGAAAMSVAAHWGPPRRKAALYASAAAIVWALVATFIKSATEILAESGVGGAVHALAGVRARRRRRRRHVLVQAALHVGPLSVSQPLLVIVDPFVSVILSIWLFQEHYANDPAAVAASVVTFAVMCVGVVALTRTAPSTMEPVAAGRPRGEPAPARSWTRAGHRGPQRGTVDGEMRESGWHLLPLSASGRWTPMP